jgi:hypothetical protein
LLLLLLLVGEFKKKDKLAKPKPSHKGTIIYRLKPFKNQVRPNPLWGHHSGVQCSQGSLLLVGLRLGLGPQLLIRPQSPWLG